MTTMTIGPDNAHQANRDDLFGFYGAILSNEGLSPDTADDAFGLAYHHLGEATGENPILIRNFLRSKWGRHLANECAKYAGTLEERIQQATGAEWITKGLTSLIRDGFEFHLFDDETIE